jgi:8-oxo-dGTP diphosphatase
VAEAGLAHHLWNDGEVSQGDTYHRAVAGLIRQHGRILLCHRSPQREWYPDRWDLPEGRVGENESTAHALTRALWEQLGIRVEPPQSEPFAHVQGTDLRVDIWLIDEWVGEPSNLAPNEHDALAWVNTEETLGFQLADPRLRGLIEEALAD